MPAKQGAHKRLVTLGEGSKPMIRDVAKWRKLKAKDLIDKGNGLVLQAHDSFAQTAYGWYLLPMQSELQHVSPIEKPDSSRGKV